MFQNLHLRQPLFVKENAANKHLYRRITGESE